MMAPRFPCLICHKNVANNHEAVQCNGCARWQHSACEANISAQEYIELTQTESFIQKCSGCLLVDEPVQEPSSASSSFNVPMEEEEPSLVDKPGDL